MDVGLIKLALDSTNDLLDTIRESTADRSGYVELAQGCVGIRELLDRGTNRMQTHVLSQSALEAIEELTTTVDKIKRNIVKEDKQRAIPWVFRSKKEKEAIAAWRLGFNRILCILEIEFGCREPVSVSGPRHNVAQPHTAASNVHPYSRTAASQVSTEAANTYSPSHETHRDTTSESSDDGHNPGVSAEESVPGESPPPLPKIFGRDELVKEIVNLLDADDLTPIALIGTGGIGKTSVALAALHDERIKQRFGHHRRFLRCDQFPPSLPNFLRRLSGVVGAGVENPTDLASLRPFLYSRKMFLVIDNAEPLLDGPNTEDILPVLEELSRLRNIYLCITSRTTIVPARCKHIDVPTLSMGAACETFYNIYRREQSDTVNDILKQLDFHPLSVTLLATAAKSKKWGLNQLEKEWEGQRTRVLRARFHGSLAATIELSLHSPMFRDLGPHARDLLGVVAFFPQGVDENNLDWLFPSITDRRNIFDHFCVLSLTHRNEGFITMLAPLRDHFRPEDPTSASLLCLAKESYFSRLSFSVEATDRGDDNQTRWITSEDMNVEHLLDIFTSADGNSEAVWDACCHFILHLYHHKPRLPVFGPKIFGMPDDYPSKPLLLLVLSSLCDVVGSSAKRRRLLYHALKLYRERGDDHQIASILQQLATINSSPDLCEEGIQQAIEAMTIFQWLGDMTGVVSCHTCLSSLFRCVGRLDDAEKSESQAIGLIDALIPTADSTSRGFFHGFLCEVYSCRGDTEKVIFHLEAAHGVAPARGDRFQLCCELAKIHIAEGRFDDAEAHVEHAGSLAAKGSSELGSLMLLRARLLRGQGKFEEARSEALCALDLVEEFGGGDHMEEVKDLLHSIDIDNEWTSMGELQPSITRWTGLRTILAALGGDISQDEEIHKAATKTMALLEKDIDHPGGPNFFQITKARKELTELMGHDDDKEAKETIAESPATPTAVDEPDGTPPPEALMRQDNGPIVIWTTDPKLTHVGQLWQALYHVPQVRHRISQYRNPHPPEGNIKVDPLSGGTGYAFSAHELFGHMELSGLAVAMGKSLMERFPHRPWEGTSPCEDVEEAYKEFSEQVEISLNDGLATRHPDWPRLFHSRINHATSQGRPTFDAKKDFSSITLGYNDGDESDNLIGCLASQVFSDFPERRSRDTGHTTTGGCTTMKPADVIAFALARDEIPLSGRSQQRRKFSFPESFCLDQFVTTSHARVQDTNVAEGGTLRETGSGPARPNNEDITKGILPSLHHFEDVVNPSADVGRHSAIGGSVAELEDGIAHTKAERKSIGTTMEQPREESQSSPSPTLARGNKYDLRAVLMDDGQKGRKHIYSYINHGDAWWKVVDSMVTQVTLETVLKDENGTDVGAGPFFLIYSRSLSGPLKSEWPEALEATYNHNFVSSGSKSRTLTDKT